MIKTGKINSLKVVRRADQGFYLADKEMNDVLLPNNSAPEDLKIGDTLDVFIYRDSEDRIIATTEKPFAMTEEFVCLEVVSTSKVGAFLDWGLSKDLLVPFREQKSRMTKGNKYVVYVFVDEVSDRLTASSKIEQFLNRYQHDYIAGQAVTLIIYEETELGFKAIIDQGYSGMLYENEVFQALSIGQKVKGYIKKIRNDGKIDLALQKPGQENADYVTTRLLEKLKENDGFLGVNDKSQPEVIYALFGCSKKNFKKSIGALYKKRIILIENEGIRLVNED